MLEKHFWNTFFLYLVVEILQLVLEISSFSEVLDKRGNLNNFSKFTDKHKNQSSRGVLSKDNLKNFTKFTEKHLWRSLFFNNFVGWKYKNVRIRTGVVLLKKVFLKRRLVSRNQLFIDPLQNRCSWLIRKVHRKKPVLESLF